MRVEWFTPEHKKSGNRNSRRCTIVMDRENSLQPADAQEFASGFGVAQVDQRGIYFSNRPLGIDAR